MAFLLDAAGFRRLDAARAFMSPSAAESLLRFLPEDSAAVAEVKFRAACHASAPPVPLCHGRRLGRWSCVVSGHVTRAACVI